MTYWHLFIMTPSIESRIIIALYLSDSVKGGCGGGGLPLAPSRYATEASQRSQLTHHIETVCFLLGGVICFFQQVWVPYPRESLKRSNDSENRFRIIRMIHVDLYSFISLLSIISCSRDGELQWNMAQPIRFLHGSDVNFYGITTRPVLYSFGPFRQWSQ